MTNGSEDVAQMALRDLKQKPKADAKQSRTPQKTSTLIITGVTRVSDDEEGDERSQQWSF